jgi:D-serine deaminase-like pyridoxal phosphate-dependent protein
MSYLAKITSPTLLLDEKICRSNLKRMADKAARHNMQLIPHFKTAQSHQIGNWAKEYGITEVTASSIKMANYLSGQGWLNIHIAFASTAQMLVDQLEHKVGFFIEIDAGYGRTGVEVSDFGLIEEILRISNHSDKLFFKGFYIHAGHSYYMPDIPALYEQTRNALSMLKHKYNSEYPNLLTRTGDTPGCAVMEDFGDIDEMGPGNFVFYDLMQAKLGGCDKSDIAVAMAVPVVDIKKDRKEILIHGGGVHFAKDVLMDEEGNKNFGEVVLLNENGWTIPTHHSYLKSISQEHGLIKASDELLASVKVGDLLGILPVHSCMTADCMGEYMTLDGNMVDHAEGS